MSGINSLVKFKRYFVWILFSFIYDACLKKVSSQIVTIKVGQKTDWQCGYKTDTKLEKIGHVFMLLESIKDNVLC